MARREARGGDLRLTVDARELAARIDAARLAIGDSIAVNGVCLTVVAFDGRLLRRRRFARDAGR